jgi:hypothetical protein
MTELSEHEMQVRLENAERVCVTTMPVTAVSLSIEKIQALLDPTSIKAPPKPPRKPRGVAALIAGKGA